MLHSRFVFVIFTLSLLLNLPCAQANSSDFENETVTVTEYNPEYLASRIMKGHNIYNPERFQETNIEKIKLYGRGIQDRGTEDMIALACIGNPNTPDQIATNEPSCDVVRNVYFDQQSQKAYYFGSIILFNLSGNDPTASERKTTLKQLAKEFRHFKSKNNDTYYKLFGIGFATMIGGSLAIILTATPVAVLGVFVAAVMTGMVTSMYFGILDMSRPVKNSINTAMQDQGKWNWTIKPLRRSTKLFRTYLSFMLNTTKAEDYLDDHFVKPGTKYRSMIKSYNQIQILKDNADQSMMNSALIQN
jgi:hypothetical protein